MGERNELQYLVCGPVAGKSPKKQRHKAAVRQSSGCGPLTWEQVGAAIA